METSGFQTCWEYGYYDFRSGKILSEIDGKPLLEETFPTEQEAAEFIEDLDLRIALT